MRRLSAIACLVVPLLGCARSAPPAAAAAAASSTRPAAELFAAGREAKERGDSVRAEQYLSLAMQQGYDRSRVLPLLLQVCLESSRLRAALNHAEPYLRDHPEDDTLRYLVANIHLGLGQIEAAGTELEQLLRRNSKNADAHYLLGVIAADSDPEAARTHFASYLRIAPRGARAAEVRSRLSALWVHADLALRAAGRRTSARALDERGPAETGEQRGYLPDSGGGGWFDLRMPRSPATDGESQPSEEGQP